MMSLSGKEPSMWTEDFVRQESRDKLARYREEVRRAKTIHRVSLRSYLAQLFREWAQRLEPTLEVDAQTTKRTY